jgi:hypothetical protein
MPHEAMFRLNALSGAHASADVQAAAIAMTRAAQHFQARAWRLRAAREHPGSDPDMLAIWNEMDAARTAFRAALEAFAQLVNRELRE